MNSSTAQHQTIDVQTMAFETVGLETIAADSLAAETIAMVSVPSRLPQAIAAVRLEPEVQQGTLALTLVLSAIVLRKLNQLFDSSSITEV